MRYETKLPKISEEYEESSIVFWHKQEGDEVSNGDVLLEVQTEKAVSEIEAEFDGILKEIYVKRGETATVGDVLCVIENEVKSSNSSIVEETMSPKMVEVFPKNDFIKVAPRLRKLARDLQVDLSTINGTGPKGKITEKDIRNAAIDENAGEPLSGIRKTIALRMKESLHSTAQLTETAYINVTNLSKIKTEMNISWNTLFLYATIKALKKHPTLNGTFKDELLKLSEQIHLGVAVDTENGLLVPVIKDADQYSLFELHEKVSDITELARAKKLPQENQAGSTFTVTNLGSFGVHFFTPIINPPEIAILGLGKIEDFLMKRNGEIIECKRLPISLTFDHQVIDGAPAARFIQTFTSLLEDPSSAF